MGKAGTVMCKLGKKAVLDHLEAFAAQVDAPAFVCRDCLRVANRKKHLCTPEPLPKKKAVEVD